MSTPLQVPNVAAVAPGTAQPPQQSPELGGYDIDFFKPQEGAPGQSNVQTQAQPPQPTSTGQQPASEGTEEYVQVRRQDYERIMSAADYFENYQREQQLTKLREAWGESYDDTYNQVAQRLAALPPDKQALLNTVEGALLIAKVIQHEQQLTKPLVEGATPPQLDRTTNTAVTQNGAFKYTKSELDNLYRTDRKAYNERRQEIDAAYAAGLVDRNS